MGQELLNRGVKPHGTLWGASALYNRKYHKTVVKTHLDFIKAGAEIIVTNSFGSRKRRLIENGLVKVLSQWFMWFAIFAIIVFISTFFGI